MVTTATASPSRAAHQASDSKWMTVLAHLGLGARAFVWVVIGVLAITVAVGGSGSAHQPDQRGALQALAQNTGGKFLLVILIIGLLGYALWRFSEAAFGATADAGKGARLKSLVQGLVYTGLGVTAISVLAGSGGNQARQQQRASAGIMAHTGGRLLIGAIGIVVVAVGIGMIVEGVTQRFVRQLRISEMGKPARTIVPKVGTVGIVARGLIFILAGVLLVEAALQHQAHKARGLDGALMTLSHQTYGTLLLALAALGLIIFGCYGFAEARWHKA